MSGHCAPVWYYFGTVHHTKQQDRPESAEERSNSGVLTLARNPVSELFVSELVLPPRTGEKGYKTHSKCSTSFAPHSLTDIGAPRPCGVETAFQRST
eukprot:3077496-Prymnesium_polylepis.1